MRRSIGPSAMLSCFFFFQAEDGIRDLTVTGVQTCALPICIQEVVVTAQRRSENAQDVPIAIQAFTGDTLQQLNVTNFDDLLKYLPNVVAPSAGPGQDQIRSEEHTSELQSQSNLVCRLLLEKKNHNHDDSIAPCTTQLHALLHGTPVPHIC